MDRNLAIAKATDAMLACGGYVTNHSLFSDVRAVVNFQLPADKTGELARRLKKHFNVRPELEEKMGTSNEEVTGQLGLTFPDSKGEFRRTVGSF